jgi:hypothetical protein
MNHGSTTSNDNSSQFIHEYSSFFFKEYILQETNTMSRASRNDFPLFFCAPRDIFVVLTDRTSTKVAFMSAEDEGMLLTGLMILEDP